jgi:hypothetical protein
MVESEAASRTRTRVCVRVAFERRIRLAQNGPHPRCRQVANGMNGVLAGRCRFELHMSVATRRRLESAE